MFMRMLSANKQNLLALMKSQAQFHGSYSEPEMEVGDLQEMLAATLTLVPESDLPELVRSLDDTADLNEAIEEAKEEDPEEWEFLDSPPPAKLMATIYHPICVLRSFRKSCRYIPDLSWTSSDHF